MKLFPSVLLGLSAWVLSSAPLWAQAVDLKDWVPAQRPAALQGVVTLTANGTQRSAHVIYQAPQRLQVRIEQPTGNLDTLAENAQTRFLDAASKRVRQLPFNVLQQWWRSWDITNGGPANTVLSGLGPEETAKFYTASAATENAADGQTAIELKARSEIETHLVREAIRTGGRGNEKYYAVRKSVAFNRPARLLLTFNTQSKVLLSRAEYDERNRLLSRTEFVTSPEGVPQSATTTDFNGNTLATWTYQLQPVAPDANALALATENQIIEDAQLRPIAEYRAANDANAQFNLGVALARQEDYRGAIAAWNAAAQSQPQATAPLLAIFEAALQIRDAALAQSALQKATPLLGADSTEVLLRRARMATLLRKWDEVLSALRGAHQAQPQNASVTLWLADTLRLRGQAEDAQKFLIAALNNAQTSETDGVDLAVAVVTLAQTGDAAQVKALLTANTPTTKLAHALLDVASDQNLNVEAVQSTLTGPRALAALASALELHGQTDAAWGVWQKIAETAPEPLFLEAQRRLMTLAAQRNDAANSLRAYRTIWSRLDEENAQRALQNTLFRAWEKAGKRDQLVAVIQSRAIATNAADEDARLWLAWQEANASSNNAEVAINSGLARFPGSAWWLSRRAESLTDSAFGQPANAAGRAVRARLLREAITAVEKAAFEEPEQPYYAIQHSLILTRRAAAPGATDAEQQAAVKALGDLQTRWPHDPDIKFAIAVQQLTLAPQMGTSALAFLQTGLDAESLHGGASSLDHAAVSTARQLVAATLRQNKDIAGAQSEYERLLDASRGTGEQLGIALNALNLFDATRNAAGAAQLMERLVSEPWAFAATQETMSQWVGNLVKRRDLLTGVLSELRDSNRPSSQLALAYLDFGQWRAAQRAASADNAPAVAQEALGTAERNWNNTRTALQELINGKDAILQSQAAALLAQDAAVRNNHTAATQFFRQALAVEPREFNLQMALTRALLSAGQAEAALQVRDSMLNVLPHDAETLRWASWISLQAKQPQDAIRFARIAVERVAGESESGLENQHAAKITLARALLEAGDDNAALDVYTQLSGPQWDAYLRAAALLDWQNQAKRLQRDDLAQQVATRMRNLQATSEDFQQAQSFLRGLG